MNRKPSGFWTKDPITQEILVAYVKGEATLDQATGLIALHCEELDVDQSRATIEADVKWYARDIRKTLGLPSLREVKASAKAATEIAAQS